MYNWEFHGFPSFLQLLHDLCKKALQADKPDIDGLDIPTGSPDPLEEDEEDLEERRSEEKEVSTPNGQTTPSIITSASGKPKKKGNTFNTLRKRMKIPHIRSQELFEDEAVSVASSARNQFLTQNSVSAVGSVVGSGT
jgi:hypothetical protein